MHAQVPFRCLFHTASAEKEDLMLQAQTAMGTYISRWTAPELMIPQEIHGNPTPHTDKQLKILLDDQYQNPISLRKEIQETYTGREL